MVSLGALWLPILLAAVLVFIVSSIVWMLLPHHRTDFRGLPNENDVRAALSSAGASPGQYTIPYAATREAYNQPEIQQKLSEGPNAFITVLPRGMPAMGKRFVLWFLFSIVVGVVCGYVAGSTLPPGTEYMSVFRVTGAVAWVAYGFAYVQDAIWFGRPWGFVFKQLGDALLYALVTAGAFGWLWPGT